MILWVLIPNYIFHIFSRLFLVQQINVNKILINYLLYAKSFSIFYNQTFF